MTKIPRANAIATTALLLAWQAGAMAADRPASLPVRADGGQAIKPTLGGESPTLAAQIETLLDEGFVFAPGRARAAQKQAAAARNAAVNDPRLDYAYGLVLLKQSQPGLAKAQFEAAVKDAPRAYWPAWQALIRLQLIDQQYEHGLTRLDEFAALVHRSVEIDTITPAQRAAARWIGLVIGAVDQTADKSKIGKRLNQAELRIRAALGAELSHELQLGIEAAQQRHAELAEQAALAEELSARKKDQKRVQEAEKIETNLSGIDQEKKDADRTKADLKKTFEEQLTKHEKQLGELERDYLFFQKQAASIEQSYLMIGRQMTALQLESSSPRGRAILQQRLAQLQGQMAAYEQEYAASTLKMGQATQQANVVVQQRAGVVQQYEAATGELVKKNAALDKWAARANDKKKKLTTAGGAAGKAKSANRHDAKLHALAAYVPFELEAEKQQLLESFAGPVQNSQGKLP